MNIITKEERQGRLMDGLDTLLYLDEKTFDSVVKRLQPTSKSLENIDFYYTTDRCEAPNNMIQIGLERVVDDKGKGIGRYYFGGEHYSMSRILETLEAQLADISEDSPKYSRIQRLLNSRGLNSFKSMYLEPDGSNAEILDKVFEILSEQDTFEKFLDYEHNAEYFSIDGENIGIEEYLKYLGQFFGNKGQDGRISNNNTISREFYIPDIDTYKQRYSQLLDAINMDRYVNPQYEFKSRQQITDEVIREGEEPEWTLSPEIYKEVYSGMQQDFSLEEQAMHIYCKLCQMFLYDEGYMYRDMVKKVNYQSTFSKEHLESLVPGSKITCYDFARVFAKMVNELNGNIEAVMISEGINAGHFFAGFYTDKVSTELEPINILESKDPTNDLMRAKNGMHLKGIRTISDREGILKKAVETVYPRILGKEPLSIKGFVQELEQTPREEIPNDVETKLQSFIEVMKTNNISGNEFVQTFEGLRRSKFFGTQLDCAYIGQLEGEGEQKRYKRKLLLRQKMQGETEREESHRTLYLIDSESLDLSLCSGEDIISKLNSGEFIYESDDHKMPGIDKEVEQ